MVAALAAMPPLRSSPREKALRLFLCSGAAAYGREDIERVLQR